MKALVDIVAKHKRGSPVGVYSLCSAHPLVIEAALREAHADGAPLLDRGHLATRSTSSAAIPACGPRVSRLRARHRRAGRPAGERVWLGGDHLGPNAWQQRARGRGDGSRRGAGRAVCRAPVFARSTSTARCPCADDPVAAAGRDGGAPRRALCARRRARAWRGSAASRRSMSSAPRCRFPGGAERSSTSCGDDARRRARDDRGASRGVRRRGPRRRLAARDRARRAAGRRVRPSQGRRLPAREGARAQPHRSQATRISSSRRIRPTTRRRSALRRWCAITSRSSRSAPARRLRCARRSGRSTRSSANCRGRMPAGCAHVVMAVMRADPRHWRGITRRRRARARSLQFSLSDRIRYYWPHPEVQRACDVAAREPAPPAAAADAA